MIKKYLLTLIVSACPLQGASDTLLTGDRKTLQLHFDVNKTIIAIDTVQGKDFQETINGILAEFIVAPWDGQHEQSYYDYLTETIAQEEPQLSRADELFKEKRSERLKQFPTFLLRYPDLLAQYQREYTIIASTLHEKELVIFPSFYTTIEWLETHYPGEYTIYLRTFGKDLPEVIALIEKNTGVRFAGTGAFKGEKLVIGTDDVALFAFFTKNHGKHYGIRDDYTHWKSHNFQASGGKPFIVDVPNADSITIFFDDNADDPDKPIIKPLNAQGQLEHREHLMARGNIVAVNSKDAILDQNYFINKIKLLITRP